VGEVLDLVAGAPGLRLVLGALAGQILPRVVDEYGRHLAEASPVSEAPVRAVLEWAALWTRREAAQARLLLERLAAPPAPRSGTAETAAEFGIRVQRLFEGETGIFPAARAS
jgi:hypothetical protein